MNKTHIRPFKKFSKPGINSIFEMDTGFHMVYGDTIESPDPEWCEYGPFIADIEITTICDGIADKGPCKFCYKSNTPVGINMDLITFKKIIDSLPETITQVALGVDAKAKSNPHLEEMLKYCRSKQIIPNVTVADIDSSTADMLARYCGAVSVSYYDNWFVFITTIMNLHKAKGKVENATLRYINVHQLVSKESLNSVYFLIDTFDKKLREYVFSIVLLGLKTRGRGVSRNIIHQIEFNAIVNYAIKKNVPIGFDSCSANKVNEALKFIHGEDNPTYIDTKNIYIQSCESTLFSCYFSANGCFYPCSFNEDKEYEISIHEVTDFITDIWLNPKTKMFREKLLANKDCDGLCMCPSFTV